MVTHENYEIEVPSKIVDGIKRQPVNRTQFLSPSEIERRDGKVFAIGSNLEVKIGRVEKMSKSKKKTVDPGPIVAQYGADAVRCFMLSDIPPEHDLPWSESGDEGARSEEPRAGKERVRTCRTR